jgi:hypothetical protein
MDKVSLPFIITEFIIVLTLTGLESIEEIEFDSSLLKDFFMVRM